MTRTVSILSLVGLAVTIGSGYVAYVRTVANMKVREANQAISGAVSLSLKAQAKTREVQTLLNEQAFRNARAELREKSTAASVLSSKAAEMYRSAADKALEAMHAVDADAARTYWSMERDSLLKRAETAEAAREGYAIAADESTVDFATMIVRMEPFAVQAARARAEAMRLMAEADSYRQQHRSEF